MDSYDWHKIGILAVGMVDIETEAPECMPIQHAILEHETLKRILEMLRIPKRTTNKLLKEHQKQTDKIFW